MRLAVATAALDVAALFLAFSLAYELRLLDPKRLVAYVSFPAYAGYLAIATPAWVLTFAACGLYATRQSYGRVSEVGRVLVAVGLGVVALILLDYFSFELSLFPGRAVPAYAFVLGVSLVLTGRQLLRWVLRSLHRRERALHNLVVVGTGPLAERVARSLVDSGRGQSVVAAVSPADAGGVFLGDRPVYATIEQALSSHRLRIDEIVQTDTTLSREESTRLMTLANDLGMGYRFVPDLYGVFAASATMATVDGVPLMEVRLTSLDGWATVGKRLVDVAGSLVGLFLLAPLFLAVALLVKVTDPAGPVLYRQQRLGRGGRTIGVFKFRSMLWEYSTGPDRPYQTAEQAFVAMGRADLIEEFALTQKVADDPRVSPLGDFLRRTSLDELPQLLNALLGHLSLVGPRPITLTELERYGEHQKSFLALKPGITGLWQVSGRSDVGYDQRVKLDVFYAENWSTLLDVTILARTITTVAARRGAY
jgi:exopolysaccharide biosynthesis polyprenyl glycosylphosphotransferase